MLEALRRRLRLRKEWFNDARVLDVGAGDHGRGTVGVDLRRAAAVDILGDGTALPVATDAVDAAVCYHVVEHLDPPAAERLFDELARVTRPGGSVHVLVDRDTSEAALLAKDETHVRRYDPAWLERVFRTRFGTVIVQTHNITGNIHNHPLTWPAKLPQATKVYLEGQPA